MSYNYSIPREKRLNPSQIQTNSGLYDVPDVSIHGLNKCTKDTLEISHPVEHIEKNKFNQELKLNLNMLRNVQGIHAPLRLMMELKSLNNVGRLPFLPSSNLLRDVILGRDDYLDFDDILNPPSVHENLVKPHVVMDSKLGHF